MLRRWLEQQRELGEDTMILEHMPALEAMLNRVPAATRGAGAAPAAPVIEPGAGGWRDTLRAAGGAPPASSAKPVAPAPAPAPLPPSPTGAGIPRGAFPAPVGGTVPDLTNAPAGLVVGSSAPPRTPEPFASLENLTQVAEMVATCTRCPLFATAKNPVPGQGHPRAEFMCVGEAPGATEDEQGLAFVGQAGQLLTQILGAIKLSRDEVFICNVLKHRPPGNRNPMPDEVAACRPYLQRQLELIQPKVILALGTFAAQTLLETKLSIGKLRGSVHRYHGIPLVVTYHPAALLRNPGWKRPTWEDVQLARRILDHARAGA